MQVRPGTGFSRVPLRDEASEQGSVRHLLRIVRRNTWASPALLLLLGLPAAAQQLRYSNHREVRIPDYATVRIGPFYSSMSFFQSVGYRYTRSEGTGTDFLYGTRRGVILEEGSEYPLISRLTTRNYLLITRDMDLDLSVDISYRHYPMGTQEDEFIVQLPPEGILGNLSTEIRWTPYLRSLVYDDFAYRTDYVDTRGLLDEYGGSEYEYFRNQLGIDTDWLMAHDKNLSLDLRRTDVLPQDDEYADREVVEYMEALSYEQRVFPRVIIGGRVRARQFSYTATDRPDADILDYSVYARAALAEGEEVGVEARPTEATTLSLRLGAAVGASASYESGGTSRQFGDVDLQSVYESESTGETASLLAEGRIETRLRKDTRHSLEYRRGLRGGFLSAFEEYAELAYRIDYKGAFTSASAFSRWSEVEPSAEALGRYKDWSAGVSWTYPLSRAADLHLTSTYSQRENETLVTDAGEVEWSNDYETWVTRLGTGFKVTRRINFDFFAQHVERTSDDERLAYKRDTVAATFTCRHDF